MPSSILLGILLIITSFLLSVFISFKLKRVGGFAEAFKADSNKVLKMQEILKRNSSFVTPVIVGGVILGLVVMALGLTTKSELVISCLQFFSYVSYFIIVFFLYDMKREGAIIAPIVVALIAFLHLSSLKQTDVNSLMFLYTAALGAVWIIYKKLLQETVFKD